MSERDSTPIKVNLEKQRPYRVQDADRDAVWVGPGEVEVPSWVAQDWGLVQAQATNVAVPADAVGAVTVETVEIFEQPATKQTRGKAK